MPPAKFTKAIKAHFGIQSRGRPVNADLQRLFGTTDYIEAGERAVAQYKVDVAETLATRRAKAYDVKKRQNAERNKRLREAGTGTKTRFDKNLKEFYGIPGQRAPSKQALKRLFNTDDYNTAFERAQGMRNLARNRLGRLIKRVVEDKEFFPIAELPNRLEEQLRRLPGYDRNRPFTFSLRSGITYDMVSPGTKIDNIAHFHNWYSKVV